MRFFLVLGIVFFLCVATEKAYTEKLVIGDFSLLTPDDNLPDAWEPMVFDNISRHTVYTLIKDNGETVIKAHSSNAASGMICTIRIDPYANPVIKWRWKIDHVLEKTDLKKGMTMLPEFMWRLPLIRKQQAGGSRRGTRVPRFLPKKKCPVQS